MDKSQKKTKAIKLFYDGINKKRSRKPGWNRLPAYLFKSTHKYSALQNQ